MPLRAIARMIQTMLYAQRFFPYYVYNILSGIEEDGEHLFLYERPAERPNLGNLSLVPTRIPGDQMFTSELLRSSDTVSVDRSLCGQALRSTICTGAIC
jgi:hypothetical protein